MQLRWVKTASLLFMGFYQPLAMAVEFSDPEIIVHNCYGCHGAKAQKSPVAKGAVPSLQALPASYIIESLTDFKYDKREGTIMNRIAKGYTEGELSAVASYLAAPTNNKP
jgi:sulfide dehydrogenase cytochrome subunit